MVKRAVSVIEKRNRSISTLDLEGRSGCDRVPCARNSKPSPTPASVIPKARTLTLAEPPSTNT